MQLLLRGKSDFGIRNVGSLADVYFKQCMQFKINRTLMPAAHVARGRPDVDDEKMLVAVLGNPSTSTRRIASRTGIPESTVWRVLHENQMRP
jgi:hypothetical protein